MALRGIRVVEMLGLAPGPFCGMLLSELGADVIVVERLQPSSLNVLTGGKRIVSINLKTSDGVAVLRRLCKSSDVLIDTYRPGVMEKLGLAPDILHQDNPRLVYARLTGYGQTGPYSFKAGHDINYAALSGVLYLLGRRGEPPSPPVNILADFAGGGLLCAFGILAALLERSHSGRGQVVDASMTEGASYVSSWLFRSGNLPIWGGEPGTNMLDGGAPFYNTYKTKDGKFMAVGALEPQFYEQFLKGLGLQLDLYPQFGQFEKNAEMFTNKFAQKTQEEWCKIFDKLDACVTPVLSPDEAPTHEQHLWRESFGTGEDSRPAPRPAPRLSRTPAVSHAARPSPRHAQHTLQVLQQLGYSHSEITKLAADGHIAISMKSSL